ncbi:MAG: DUF3987 domain-containing protein, partial [Schwartzia sp.]|nr:DUF3987 domain-containing protein [Schwartzia sp. (in: firmicutes)]
MDAERKLPLCLGSGRQAAVWRPVMMSIGEIWLKVKNPIRTAETMGQYKKMTRPEREAVKDKGAFLAGTLKGTRRKREEVLSRSMVTLDYDKLTPDFFEDYERSHRFFTILYTTHSHTPEAPRARLLIPLARDVTPEEYNAIVRYVAAEIGMEMIDICSFKINQPMFWPNCSKDGQYIHRRYEGGWLDPDEYLAAHPNWRDYTTLPTAPAEKEDMTRQHKTQEDPRKKAGIVGAFSRSYSIRDVIAKFLSHVYAPSAKEGRYDYIPGEGSAGVVIYDDKFAYSHHATDPAGGRLLNAFDLVRIHLFPEDDDKTSFLKMRALAENDEPVRETLETERLAEAQRDFEEIMAECEEPIPFGRYDLAPFPVDALPPDIADYVTAVSESTQTPVDMAGTAALALTAACVQGKYVIRGKADWTEPVNLFADIIASPSERKSAVLHATVSPMDSYEVQYNIRNAGRVEGSKMRKRILERRQKAIEDKVAKGNAEEGELERIAQEIADFVEEKPLHLYVDDVTTEKLVSIMASNHGRAALISSEGGIFDTLAGIYTRNVNIDVMLKGYSGDTIRVDRIGRESESIMNPTLTVLLMTQPKVISEVLGNATFRGRGLTARFLYCLPTSSVGERRFQSEPVSPEVYQRYEQRMVNMLEDEYPPKPEVITLSAEASELLTSFAEEIEPKMKAEYAEIADWVGKLVGNTLRIAGLLCRASVYRTPEFLTENDRLVVSGETMADAIRL